MIDGATTLNAQDATDLKRILVIGSGPIVIGQACEFDYSGTQACKALRDEGLEVVLVNSNPATIMTDPELADRTYVEPLTRRGARERSSSASGPTRCCRPSAGRRRSTWPSNWRRPACSRSTASSSSARRSTAIKVAEDRLKFKDAMRSIGIEVPESASREVARAGDRSRRATLGFPLIIRPSFTLGGVGGGIAYNVEEFREHRASAGSS